MHGHMDVKIVEYVTVLLQQVRTYVWAQYTVLAFTFLSTEVFLLY